MKPVLSRACLALLIAFGSLSAAQAAGHYVPGVEGIQAASVPPPGLYYLGYMVNYSVDSLRAPGASDDLPLSNTGTVSALANRVVWISQSKVLGADFGMETIVPVLRKSLAFNAAGVSESKSGVGDVYLGPLVLGWHGPRWDAVAAAGVWLDSGAHSDLKPSSPGEGYKATMLTGGGTYYFDEAKSLSGSALVRYEINGRKDSGFKPGRQVSLEWGVGKAVGPVQLGLVGYDQWQVSDDSGTNASGNRSARHALGAEVVYPIMSAGVILKAAAYKEYSAKGGTGPEPKGSLVRFTFIKVF